MVEIHPTAIVDPKAQLGADVKIAPYAVVEKDVVIGDGTQIGPHAVIANGARMGKNCRVFTGAVISTEPQDLKFADEKTFVEIGDNTTIREFATVNRATSHSYYTRVGSNCLLMAYSHIAHDCQIGNFCTIANSVNMAGHVIIGDYVGIGGLTAIHQFVHIGDHAFIGGGLRVSQDIPPFILAAGEPIRFAGLNAVGLRRRGFSREQLDLMKKAYHIVYRENLRLKEAIERIEQSLELTAEVKKIVEFLKNSERGIIRPER
ncbi:acyl-ACP--UDP-N-acetylglucosamine O-acyltransferase [Caldithrix abyssi]|uniref:Acyl-[acyl-carrier-protein]--UDP-N-acetylglucosamine O-acyltransferase n=1 Tax=Caldithrix abyssi DSM 13497 TaxID=880073 RepID=H1XNM3_CALAY|nr:acyl-ACP--UDP-N-acetylglucosamine O-acyltransferase [Caldithrix abyssi]APF19359.1 lpxA acyl-(acyl-carrier-protein)--UDP-N-acetylglucosamine O-acyltransferase [Caldithrix abyssi DSM 13497]EHO43261.1 Acyl-(acyl-carrier-protein)--UDP-N-acetylglucosa mineO-acyltransferase [Caldithrix abyssi DSM 13497]